MPILKSPPKVAKNETLQLRVEEEIKMKLGRYMMPSGGSVGEGYGPMIVATRNIPVEEISKIKIAVPGTMTTAYLALKLFAPDAVTEAVQRFDVAKRMREFHSGHSDLVRGHAVEHERVVRVWAVRYLNLAGLAGRTTHRPLAK